MPITLDIPPHLLEKVRKNAFVEGISLDEWIVKVLDALPPISEISHSPSTPAFSDLAAPVVHTEERIVPSKLGLFRGAVLVMAEDFDAIPEGFEEYVQ